MIQALQPLACRQQSDLLRFSSWRRDMIRLFPPRRCGAQKWLLPENGRPYQRLWPEWRDRMSPLPEP